MPRRRGRGLATMVQMCCDFTTSTAHPEYKSGTNTNFSNIILKKGSKIRGIIGNL